ncbi:DUF2339 domain-containing protein [Labilibacter marinus]|uniref:DUF2339 domain-containing protein n=1 Tax=Labilibacter marinus TaxID=1477105 RepID=UPI00094FF3A4|nr:DUF2339 domain-containing protein [Labilibacter marinus]
MNNSSEKINQLEHKLDLLVNQQIEFSRDVAELRKQLRELKKEEEVSSVKEMIDDTETPKVSKLELPDDNISVQEIPVSKPTQAIDSEKLLADYKKSRNSISLEKFIGENLLNKVGIAILVIGIAIGTKYSIDNNLISPLGRIILGYLSGIGLLLVGMKLRAKYENYSAVLVSGAMTTMYFITYAAYSFFGLIPQFLTFALMVVFTIFTVIAALSYKRQVIAHIGMVGAYAVPFLLSNESGNALVLFTYMAIINIGILVVSFKQYWKPLYYVSFGLTWLIYFSWYFSSFDFDMQFSLALVFASIFFISFYITFLAYKINQNETFKKFDLIPLLSNSFIFYGIGYALLSTNEVYDQFLGLYTLVNGMIHLMVGLFIHKKKLADRNLFYFVVGLVLVFVTIAIPVQLDGNWVTLLWLCQAVLLYWIGKTKQVSLYEVMAYPLMLIAFGSLLHDWAEGYQVSYYAKETIESNVINIYFLTSIVAIAAYGYMQYLSGKYAASLKDYPKSSSFIYYALPAVLVFVIYYALHLEISLYWDTKFVESWIDIKKDESTYDGFVKNFDINKFKTMWLFNYTFLFAALGFIVNVKKIKNTTFTYAMVIIASLTMFLFITNGIYTLGELRDSFVSQENAQYYKISFFHVAVRYVSILLVGLTIYTGYLNFKNVQVAKHIKIGFELFIHATILVLLANELITWLSIYEVESAYKTALSILLGVYALFLIVVGIRQNKAHLRISAIALLGLTLLKLFFYDLVNLRTIEKIIVFVALGLLLLIISFLYNKYKPVSNE